MIILVTDCFCNRLPAVTKPRTYTVVFIPRKSIHCVKKFEVSSTLRERDGVRESQLYTYYTGYRNIVWWRVKMDLLHFILKSLN